MSQDASGSQDGLPEKAEEQLMPVQAFGRMALVWWFNNQ
jgi:hypothetical protein